MQPLVTLDELKRKCRYIKPNRYSFLSLYPSRELAEFIGMLLSDGTANKDGALVFVNSDKFLIERWRFLLDQLFHKNKISTKLQTGFKHKKEDFVVRITSNAIVRVLREMHIPLGRRSAQSFHVPLFIKNPKFYEVEDEEGLEIQRSFLRAIFSCDGTKPIFKIGKWKNWTNYKLWIRLGFSKDEKIADSCVEFLQEIKDLLKNFGIATTKIYHYPPRRDFFFNISTKSSIINFHREIGYSIDSKQKELEKIVDFINNFESIFERRKKERAAKILNFLRVPHTTMEVKNMVGLHHSKTILYLDSLCKEGLISKTKIGRGYIWTRR